MPSRQNLFSRRCVLGLVQVIEQLPSRAEVRLPLILDSALVGMLLLWTILRWERTFLLLCLEELGVDMWGLTRELDALIEQRKAENFAPIPEALNQPTEVYFWQILDRWVEYWLERTGQQAAELGHAYLGTEHLLLAILAEAHPALSALLARHGLDHGRVKDAVLAVLARRPMPRVEESVPAVVVREGPLGARWDTTPAIGVPRRFGVGILLLMMTMFSVLFAAMRVLGAPPDVFIVIAVLFAGVGLGQMVLYGGKHPRAASIWVGAGLLPVEVVGLMFFVGPTAERIALLFVSPLLGAGLGYLAGGLSAGVFLLLQEYDRRHPSQREQGEEQGPLDAPDDDSPRRQADSL